MTITDQQRKLLWIVGGILVAAYFAPSIIMFLFQVQASQRVRYAPRAPQETLQARAGRKSPNGAGTQTADSSQPNAPQAPRGDLMGKWQGAAPPSLSGEVCNLKLELKGEETDPMGIKGFGTIQCTALGPLISTQAKGNLRAAVDIATRGVATSVLMTGTTQKDGVMQFHIDKIIGPESSDRCVMSSFKLTPFGSQLLSEWQNGEKCKGGEATLNRVR